MSSRKDVSPQAAASPARGPGRPRYLHVTADARRRYDLAAAPFGLRGRLLFGDARDAYTLAWRINEVRRADRYPELAIGGGELFAAVLLHELMHALIESHGARTAQRPMATAWRQVQDELGSGPATAELGAFAQRFPAPVVASGDQPVDAYLTDETEGTPNLEVVLEEALLVRLANANPALERLKELCDDAPLRERGGYARTLALLERSLERERLADEGGAPDADSLMALLWGPQRSSPTSLEGQLRFARERWGPLLGDRYAELLARLARSIDALREERSRGPGGPGPAGVLDAASLRQHGEQEAFSSDSDWMGSVVLIAKSTYVWLAQLEISFGREVRRLDQIPDEALAELAERGFNGLWLIGLWERSEASRRIKQRRGQPGALASAYALYDYVIAEDLGGEPAFADLKERARRHGIRLAGDMVPNHVGVDGRWVAEHPDWFIQLGHPPYPGYRFDGPDVSSHSAMAVVIEDHYWDDSDAAVVFKRVDRGSGEARFIYHGNDGTSMPWNDTAQLDYLKPEVREAVIRTILHVARLVPIIRFDAAMTLAKRHIQRLWYPPPGEGGAIPSRSTYGAISDEEFERLLPVEFWREVVDRVSAEAPGTLLLAEAFWMMEGYFVRTLGMHRVYNSAFMNMLKREDNAEYRQLVKNVLAFDPRILGRFVNFMNNPDEETAIAQFGDGDKYFGVCVLMATMPGLPMFGHGQVEGFREKYGMEYSAPTFDERPDQRLVERHQREIAPLLNRRRDFAGAETFRFFDAVEEHGRVNEDVFAYSNRAGRSVSLVLYNNRYPRASGRVKWSVAFAEPWAGGGTHRETVHQALGLAGGPRRFTVLPDGVSGLSYLRRSEELFEHGLSFDLDGFQAQVFVGVHEVEDEDGSYAGLEAALAGAGVRDLESARLDWRHRLVRERFLALLDAAAAVQGAAPEGAAPEGGAPAGDAPLADPLLTAAHGFLEAAAEHGPLTPRAGQAGAGRRPAPGAGSPPSSAKAGRDGDLAARIAALLRAGRAGVTGRDDAADHDAPERDATGPGDAGRLEVAPALARAVRAALTLAAVEDGADRYRSLRLAGALEERLRAEGADEPEALAALPEVLLRVLPDIASRRGPPPRSRSAASGGRTSAGGKGASGQRRTRPAEAAAGPGAVDADAVLRHLQLEPAVHAFLQVHDYDGQRWFVGERYRLLRQGLAALLAAAGVPDDARRGLVAALAAAEEASGYRFERLQPTAAAGGEPAAAPRRGKRSGGKGTKKKGRGGGG